MRLGMFRTKGFKNLTQEVALDQLGPINVIHGDNNVGKSNVLEAMQWFFHFLGLANRDGFLPIVEAQEVSATYDIEGKRISEAFNIDAPHPIEMEATVETNADEFEKAGISQLIPATRVTIGLRFELLKSNVGFRVTRFRFGDGTDASAVLESAERKAYVLRFAQFLARSLLVDSKQGHRFSLISAERAVSSGGAARGPLTAELCLALYDAKEATARTLHQGWERFAHAMASFGDNVEGGTFTAVYNREQGRAHLVMQRPSHTDAAEEVRVLAHLLGSGIQQVAALLGHLVTTGSAIVAIEEPELNLRYALQVRLRDLLSNEIVGKPGCPSQLFLTSHSPAFEVGTHFYAMVPGPGGPRVERRPLSEARLITGVDLELPPSGDGRAPGYVSSDGLLALPQRVRQKLGLENGGGVMFVDRPGKSVELLSDYEFLQGFSKEGTT